MSYDDIEEIKEKLELIELSKLTSYEVGILEGAIDMYDQLIEYQALKEEME